MYPQSGKIINLKYNRPSPEKRKMVLQTDKRYQKCSQHCSDARARGCLQRLTH